MNIGDVLYLKERESLIRHEGERPLTSQTPVTGRETIQFPRGTAVEVITVPARAKNLGNGYLIIRAVNTEFYSWCREDDLLQRKPADAALICGLGLRFQSLEGLLIELAATTDNDRAEMLAREIRMRRDRAGASECDAHVTPGHRGPSSGASQAYRSLGVSAETTRSITVEAGPLG